MRKEIVFQALDWSIQNENIICFGRDTEGASISVKIKNVKFPFYVSVGQFDQVKLMNLIKYLKSKKVNFQPTTRKIFDCRLNNNLEDKIFKFIRIDCKNVIDFYCWRKKFKNGFQDEDFRISSCELYNAHIKPLLMFFHMYGFQANGWYNVYRFQQTDKYYSSTEINIETSYSNLNLIENCKEKSRFKIASFDLETEGTDPGGDKRMFQVGITFKELYNDKSETRVLLSLHECDPIKDTIVESFKTEKELILGTIETLLEYDFDILTGFNTFGFDNNYIYKRAKLYNIEHEFKRLGRISSSFSDKIVNEKMSGKGEGFQPQCYFNTMTGRVQMDLLPIIKKNYKLQKYSLSHISQTFLDDDKVNLSYEKMFELWDKGKGSPESLAIIGEYCVKDTVLPINLIEKLNLLTNAMEYASIAYFPLGMIFTYGETQKR